MPKTKKEYTQWAWEWESNVERVYKLLRRGLLDRMDEEWVERDVQWLKYSERVEEDLHKYDALKKKHHWLNGRYGALHTLCMEVKGKTQAERREESSQGNGQAG